MTPAEIDVLDFVRGCIAKTGVAPTMVEIADYRGSPAKSTAKRLVDGLVAQGALLRTANCSRGLRLPGRPILASVPTEDLRAELDRRRASQDGVSHEQE